MLRRLLGAHAKNWVGTIGILVLVVWSGCGGGGGGGSANEAATSRIAFRVQWDRTSRAALPDTRAGVDDCLDVETVSAAVYTGSDLLQEGGPWNCADGRGTLPGVLAGNTVQVAVVGHAPNGRALYRGESVQSFFLPAGATVDAGVIVASSFVPTLTAPADGAFMAPANLVLRWNAVGGASRYQVTIYSDSDFMTPVHTIAAAAAPAPSCRPEENVLNAGIQYFWRVQAVDNAGNYSEFSEGRNFYLSSTALAVTITVPPDDALVLDSSPITFEATVADPEGNPLSSTDLTSVLWASNWDGPIGTQLSFTTNPDLPLTVGTHTITLDVVANNGMGGTATVTLQVVDNMPPVALIIEPVIGEPYEISSYDGFACIGEGSDYEDGNLTGNSLIWSIVDLADPGNVFWTGSGEYSYIEDVPEPQSYPGTYRITLVVTDSGGATDTVYRDLTILE
jgi:hypothetical protein